MFLSGCRTGSLRRLIPLGAPPVSSRAAGGEDEGVRGDAMETNRSPWSRRVLVLPWRSGALDGRSPCRPVTFLVISFLFIGSSFIKIKVFFINCKTVNKSIVYMVRNIGIIAMDDGKANVTLSN